MTSNQPPSYQPERSRSRPYAGQARKVGSGEIRPAANPTRRRSIMPQTSGEPDIGKAHSAASATGMREESSRQRAASANTQNPPAYHPARTRNSQARSASAASVSPLASSPARSVSSSQRRTQSDASQLKAQPYAPQSSSSARSLPNLKIRPWTFFKRFLLVFILLLIAWVVYLFMYGNAKLDHINALSGRANTPGDTYLIVGSDKREEGVLEDGWDGERSDTIMILQLPDTGHAALISLPRDTLVDIPGYGPSKINAAYSYGGAPLLVETVEDLTGLTVDHYIEVSMGGVKNLVNAVGGVNVCYDNDVSDTYSGMEWTAGCHDINGDEALSFSRMRYADPRGDIGRTDRQRQVVSKVVDKAISPSTFIRPLRQRALVAAVAENLRTDPDTSLFGLLQAGIGLRSVMGEGGLMGTPPISNMAYWYDGQACVQLNPNVIDEFWEKLARGELTSSDFDQLPVG